MKLQVSIIVAYIFFLIAILGCNNGVSVKVEKRSGIALVNVVKSNKIDVSDVSIDKIVAINGPDSLLVTGENKLIYFENKYYLADRKLGYLYILDSSGRITKKVGEIGAEMGNYLSLESFNIDEHSRELLVYSLESGSMLKFTLLGEFIGIRRVPFYAYDFAKISDDRFVFFINQNTSKKSGNFNVLVTNSNYSVKQRLFDISHLPPMVFGYTGFLLQKQSSFLFAEPFSDTIYKYSKGKLETAYKISFGERQFPTRTFDFTKLFSRFDSLSYCLLLNQVFESDTHLFFKYLDGTRVKCAVFSKKGKRLITAEYENSPIFYTLLNSIVGVNNDKFYSILDFNILHARIKQKPVLEYELRKIDMNLFDLFKNSTPLSNPAIVEIKFKS